MAVTSAADQLSREPSDAELIRRTRDGDADAYGALFARHADAATMLASRLTAGTPVSADDVVSDAFLGVLSAIRSGHGPEESFRPYLYTAVRNGAATLRERELRAIAVDDPADYEKPEPAPDPAVTAFESEVVQRAFASLPERWQAVLWYHEVEAMKPAAIAPLLGVSPNGVSALLVRAREGLREAYLVEHLGALDTSRPECAWAAARLGAQVRGSLSRRDRRKVSAHLAGCADCRAMAAEVAEVDRGLHVVVAPLVLGGAGAAWLAARRAEGGTQPTAQGATGGPAAGATRLARSAGSKAAPIAVVVAASVVMAAMVALAVTGVLGRGGETPAAPETPVAELPQTDDDPADDEPEPSTEPSDDGAVDATPDPAPRGGTPKDRPPVVPNPSDEEEPPVDPVGELPVVQTPITGVLTVLDADHPTLALAGPVRSAIITWVSDEAPASEMIVMQTPGGEFALGYTTLAGVSAEDGSVQYVSTADATAMVSAIGDGQWALASGIEVIDWRLDIVQDGDEVAGVQLDGMFELAAGQQLSVPLIAPGSGVAYITTFDGSHPESTVVDGVLSIRALGPTIVKQILVVFTP